MVLNVGLWVSKSTGGSGASGARDGFQLGFLLDTNQRVFIYSCVFEKELRGIKILLKESVPVIWLLDGLIQILDSSESA